MSMGGIQGVGQSPLGVGKAAGAQGKDPKIQELEQELKQIEEGIKLASSTGNQQLLAMLQQQLQGVQQSAEGQAGQDSSDQRGGGRGAVAFEARQRLNDVQQRAESLVQEIQQQLQSVQAQAGNQSSQGSGGFQQDSNQAQGRDIRALYPM